MRLIDADALKKALKNGCENCLDANTNWCERCCPHNDFDDLIDNAPTVVAKSCKKLQEIANERPKPHPAEFCDEDCIHCKMIDECEKADGGES